MNILITDVFSAGAMARLLTHSQAKVTKAKELRPNAEELKDTEILIVRSRTKVDQLLLTQAPKLKLIITATSGFDHIDYQSALRKNIKVAFAPEANAASAAELTLALMLNLVRHVPRASQNITRNGWRTDDLRGETLEHKTLGIVGLGRIGSRVAKLAKALGMNIIASDPYQPAEAFENLGAARLGLTEVLIGADVITLHVPLTKETRNLINFPTLQLINPEAFLINVSRGEVIDELELSVAMDKGILRGAALDVFEREPLPQESKLRGRKNVLLTPHIGAFTQDALDNASNEATDKALAYIDGREVKDQLPLNTRWFDQIDACKNEPAK